MAASVTTPDSASPMVFLRRHFELSTAPDRLLAMEGLRGVAVLFVFFVHSVSSFRAWLPASGPNHFVAIFLESSGHMGVDLFFVLSGFLIWPQPLRSRFDLGRFLRRRVERIYPAFLVVLAVTTVLMWIRPPNPAVFPEGFLAGLAYFAANVLLLPGIFSITPIVTVAWTLSFEFFFYLAAPFVVRVGRLATASRRTRILVLVGLIVALFVGRALFPWVRLRMTHFLMGAILAEVRGLGRTPRVRDPLPWAEWAAWGLVPLAGAVTFVLQDAYGERAAVAAIPRALFTTMAMTALVWAALGRTTVTGRWFSVTPLRWLGNMSYSYYLTHFLALKLFAEAVAMIVSPTRNAWAFWGLNLVGFGVTLPVAAALFLGVERPFSLPSAPRARTD